MRNIQSSIPVYIVPNIFTPLIVSNNVGNYRNIFVDREEFLTIDKIASLRSAKIGLSIKHSCRAKEIKMKRIFLDENVVEPNKNEFSRSRTLRGETCPEIFNPL